MEISDSWKELATNMADQILNYSLNLLGAVILLVAGWLIAGLVRRRLLKLFRRTRRIDDTLAPFLSSIVRYAILIVVLVLVLGQFGVQTASIIAVLGAAGLALGLALQGTLANVAAGLMILFLRPFKVGDYVRGGGVEGTVDEIGLFVTQMHTFDGVFLAVPNSDLWNSTITNYTRLPTRRLDVTVGISYGDDIGKAMGVLERLMEGDDRVMRDPSPMVLVNALADSSVNLQMRAWTHIDNYWTLMWDMNRAAKERLEAAGITIPFPQRDLHFVEPLRITERGDS